MHLRAETIQRIKLAIQSAHLFAHNLQSATLVLSSKGVTSENKTTHTPSLHLKLKCLSCFLQVAPTVIQHCMDGFEGGNALFFPF